MEIDKITNHQLQSSNYNVLIDKIFQSNTSNNNILIKNSNLITSLLTYLHTNANSLISKLEILTFLEKSFAISLFNMEIISRYKESNSNLSFYQILIMLYLENEEDKEEQKQLRQIIIKILNTMVHCITCKFKVYKFLNSYIIGFVRGRNNKGKLTRSRFMNYLHLLKICYGSNYIKIPTPDNYFYFSNNGEIKITNKENKLTFKNQKTFTIIFWFELIVEPRELDSIFQLISFTFKDQITFDINKKCELYSNIKKGNLFQFQTHKIYNVLFKIYQSSSIEIELYINKEKIMIDKHRKISNSELNEISLFKNFGGLCSSILIFDGPNYQGFPKYLLNKNNELIFQKGIYNEELFEYLIEEIIGKNLNFSFTNIINNNGILKETVNRLFAIYIPTRTEVLSDKSIILKDSIGKLNAQLIIEHKDLSGVHIYEPLYNKIANIGGINSLLPLIELMASYKNYPDTVEDLSSIDILEEYFFLVQSLLSSSNSSNVDDANNSKFFECLSLFIEKLPREFFTLELFGFLKIFSTTIIYSKLSSKLCDDYHYNILFNENILFKFPLDIQSQFWTYLNWQLLLEEEGADFLKIISIKKICNILLLYDKERLEYFCCETHVQYFTKKEKVSHPEMSEKLKKIEPIMREILKYNLLKEEACLDLITIFELLLLDISPCLKLFIIDSFTEMIKNIQYGVLKFHPSFLMAEILNKILEISYFAYSTTLIDIRVCLFEFIFLLFKFNSIELTSQPEHETFIENNLLPIYMTIEDDRKEKEKENKIIIGRKNITKNKFNYELQIPPQGKQYLRSKMNELVFLSIAPKMFNAFIENKNFTDKWMKQAINFSIKISPFLEISNSDNFLSFILFQIEEQSQIKYSTMIEDNIGNSQFQSILKENDFFHWILEITFQCFLIKEIPDYKSVFISLNREISEVANEILEKSKKIIPYLLEKNYQLEDYLLTWGTYYKILFESNRIFYDKLLKFIREFFDKFIKTNLKLSCNRKINGYKQALMFSNLFEFTTFYRTDNYHAINYIKNDIIQIPESFNPSFFIKTTSKKEEFLSTKWENYDIIKSFILNVKETYNWNDILLKSKDGYSLDFQKNIMKKRLEVNISEFFISSDKEGDNKNIILIIPLIKTFIVLLSLFIKEADKESEIIEWVEEYKDFLLFLIMQSTKNEYKENMKDIYNQTQNNVKYAVVFGLCFLINEYQNRREYMTHFEKAIKAILKTFANFYQGIEKIEEEKEISKNRIRKLNFWQGEENLNLKKCFLYNLVKEYDLKPMFKDVNNIPQLIQKEEFKQKFAILQNLKDKIEENLFNYQYISQKRREMIKTFIPTYETHIMLKENNITYDNSLNQLCLTHHYLKLTQLDIKVKNSAILYSRELRKKLNIYAYRSKFEHFNKVKNYKKIKKRLFSFKGIWSEGILYYNHKLKYHIANHFTREFTRIMLKPIYDIDSYLPVFSNFKKNNLFRNNESDNNNNNINTHSTVLKAFDLQIEKEDKDDNQQNIVKQKNILYYIYKEFGLLNITEIISIKDNFRSFISENENIKKNIKESILECCLITKEYHIKGFFFYNNISFGFYAFDLEYKKDSEDYDDYRNSCNGSIFKAHPNKKKHYYFTRNLNDIEMILKRRYLMRRNSLEIFTNDKKNYFFKFDSNETQNDLYNSLSDQFNNKNIITIDNNLYDKKIGFSNSSNPLYIKNPHIKLSDLYSQWWRWEISTLELLMYLNIYANRTYNDTMQYPVCPWVLMDYTSNEIDLKKDDVIRNFALPMGMITSKNAKAGYRRGLYLMHYQTLKQDGAEFPFFYGSHYSNALYIAHYLVRVFPFTHIHIEVQGKTFDDPYRLFIDISKSFECATTQKCDVRELIPEFFCLPEMFLNNNNLNLGKIKLKEDSELILVEDVGMPRWSDNNPYIFIEKYRRCLESEEVSGKIHLWFDLIFGVKQKGNKAFEAKNLFSHESYEDFEENFKKMDLNKRIYSIKLLEFGVTPNQIFGEFAYGRKKIIEMGFPPVIHDINNKIFESINVNNNNDDIISIQLVSDGKLLKLCAFGNKIIRIYNLKLKTSTEERKNELIESGCLNLNDESYKIFSSNNRYKVPYVVYDYGNYIAIGGYWNGMVKVVDMKNQNDFIVLKDNKLGDYSPITIIKIDIEEILAACGNKEGRVKIYLIDRIKRKNWICKYRLYDHTDEITDMAFNRRLNVFCSISRDKYMMIYTIPMFKLVNCVKFDKSPEMCIISGCPLPCYLIYFKNEKEIEVYSINGKLFKKEEVNEEIIQWKLYRNHQFMEYVIYSTKEKKIKVKEIPSLEEKFTSEEGDFKGNLIGLELNNNATIAVILELDKNDMKLQILRN